jgi:hypothetical protein
LPSALTNFVTRPTKNGAIRSVSYLMINKIPYFQAGTAIADRKAWHELFVTFNQPGEKNEIHENR